MDNEDKNLSRRWIAAIAVEIIAILLLVVFFCWPESVRIFAVWWDFWSDNRENMSSIFLAFGAVFGIPLLLWREATAHRQANTAADRHRKQTEADRERRITDSFTKAVELLGNNQLEVRLGAIYALERIARESERDYWPIMETLTAYVRTRAGIAKNDDGIENVDQKPTEENEVDVPELAVDIQAVLTVLGRREVQHERW
jgi:hypothetical protein